MSRAHFEEGQEILPADLIRTQQTIERQLYQMLAVALIRDPYPTPAIFFEQGLRCYRNTNTELGFSNGFGLQYDEDQESPESTWRPLLLDTYTTVEVTAAHATLNRIDIVCVKNQLVDEITATRNYKPVDELDPIEAQEMVVQKAWGVDFVVVPGTASGSPAVPTTPDGYVKIAEVLITAAVGVDSDDDITDTRVLADIGIRPWLNVRTYTENEIATYNGEFYVSLQDNNWNNAPSDPAWWGSQGNIVRTVTASGAVNVTDYLLRVDATGGNKTMDLPTAAAAGAGRTIRIKNVATNGNTVTIDAYSTETIDGALTYVLESEESMESVTLVSTGTEWNIV